MFIIVICFYRKNALYYFISKLLLIFSDIYNLSLIGNGSWVNYCRWLSSYRQIKHRPLRLVLNSIPVTVGSSTVGSLVKTLSILMIVTGVCILMATWFSLLGVIFRKKYLLITVRTEYASKTKRRHVVINDVEKQHMGI